VGFDTSEAAQESKVWGHDGKVVVDMCGQVERSI
jgi:hypothetical protein